MVTRDTAWQTDRNEVRRQETTWDKRKTRGDKVKMSRRSQEKWNEDIPEKSEKAEEARNTKAAPAGFWACTQGAGRGLSVEGDFRNADGKAESRKEREYEGKRRSGLRI